MIRPNGEEKQVRPKREWQPGANTLGYRPLTSTSTVNDMSGNNKNMSAYKGTVSYGTYKGVDCGYFANAGLNVSTLSLSNTMTLNAWAYIETTSYYNQMVTILGPQSGTSPTSVLSFWYNTTNERYSLSSFKASKEIYIYENITGKRVNICYSYNNGTCTLYLDGVYKGQYTNNITWSTYLTLGYLNSGDRMYGGGISNVILENKVRTAQEVADYFNLTKGDYGIS